MTHFVNNRTHRSLRTIMRDRRGETITEVLVSMVIAGLALLMLATVIATSSNIVRNSRADMETYYKTSNALASFEAGEGVTKEENKKITSGVPLSIDADGNESDEVTVDIYSTGSGDDAIVSYETKAATTP